MASWQQTRDNPPCNTYAISTSPTSPPRITTQYVTNSAGQHVFHQSPSHSATHTGQLNNAAAVQQVFHQQSPPPAASHPLEQVDQSTYYSGYNAHHPFHTSPPHTGQPAYNQGSYQQQLHELTGNSTVETEPIAFFLFFNCKMTGTNIHKDKIVEIAIQCWPYLENAPVFHSKVDNSGWKGQRKQQDRGKKGQKKDSSSQQPDERVGHPFPVVWRHLMQWLERIMDHATSVIGTQIYPVFVAHHGDTYDFHFLFHALEIHNIGLEAPSKLDIHFCDPVPLLQQYKEYAHPWLIESRSMALGSLLNNWLPGQFDIGDLYLCLEKTHLAAKLYTQTPMYWLLKEFPLYTAKEWIEYYQEVKEYREDKFSLEKNFPTNVPEVQRKFAVRSLLRWGYNWDRLLELYAVCTSPEHFRQELKDCDVKSGPASQLTWKLVDMKLPQDGTREYKVRIKKDMLPQRYTHLTDRRGRWWILRVKNELPPCIYSMNDLYVNLPSTSQWKVPENLLLIRFPEAWCPMPGDTPNEDEVIDQLQLGGLTFNSDDNQDSCDSWDEEEDEEAAMRQALQPLEDLVKEQAPPPPITTLQFGDETTAFNPFTQSRQKDLQSELRKDDAKQTKSVWASVKETPSEPSIFGQAIKFCRPSGSEDQQARMKRDREDEQNNQTKKSQQNKRGNSKGGKRENKSKKGVRTFGRSQSWTPESSGNEAIKPDKKLSKSRTVSCSAETESCDDNQRFQPNDQGPTNAVDATSEPRGNAAAQRMINFHLAKNNRRPRKGRGGNGGGKRSDSSQGQEEQSQKRQENSSGRRNEQTGGKNQESSSWGKRNQEGSPWDKRKPESSTNVSRSKQFSKKDQLTSVSRPVQEEESWDVEKPKASKASEKNLASTKESPKSNDDDKRSPQTRPPQLLSKSRYPASWGTPVKGPRAKPLDSLFDQEENRLSKVQNSASTATGSNVTETTDDTKVLDESCRKSKSKVQRSSKTTNLGAPQKQGNEGNSITCSQIQEEETWGEKPMTSVSGAGATDDDDKASVISLGAVSQSSVWSNNSGSSIRPPREVSKAQTVAQRAKRQENTNITQPKLQQPQENSNMPKTEPCQESLSNVPKREPSQEALSPAFVEGKTYWGSKSQAPNGGFYRCKGRTDGVRKKDAGFGRNNGRGSRNDRWRDNVPKSNCGDSSHGNGYHNQPVVVNNIEASENWDEEVGVDECYGL